MVSAIETGKLQQGSNDLKEAVQQLTTANKELRDVLDECKEGMVEGYLDLEIMDDDNRNHQS